MKHLKEVSIVCELGFAIYSAKPIVEYLTNIGVTVYIYTHEDNILKASEYLSVPTSQVCAIQMIERASFSVLDYLVKQLLVSSDFSSQHKRVVEGRKGGLGWIGKVLRILPKPSQSFANVIYSKLWYSIHRRAVFATEDVLYFTYSQSTYLLNNKKHNIYTIVESWDHPAKAPFFVSSEKVFVWNNALSHDVKKFQGYENSEVVFPLKFRYIEELEIKLNEDVVIDEYVKDIDFIKSNNFVLYICTYSNFSGSEFFSKELFLIKEIAKICSRSNKLLYIRPHPHCRGDEFKSLYEYGCVFIGRTVLDSGFNCVFSEKDQVFKMLLLRQAELIINVGTTLVLEAALLNESILQIDLDTEVFEGFARASNNYHIKTHLNSQPGVLRLGIDMNCLEEIINFGPGSEFSESIRQWLISRCDLKESIHEIVGVIEQKKISEMSTPPPVKI